jgi:DNA-binding NtrC family response regulator
LRMMEAQGDPISQQMKMAAKVVNDSHRSFDPSAHLAIRYCADLLKRHENREALVVPARFGLVGVSSIMAKLRDRITRFAISSSPVLIRGESGTGKELVARAIHAESDRCDAPFIVVNCPAIPEGVFESNLFGHLEGSYTGANRTHRGLIEEAGSGTLFLDEVGDLPQGVQAKLLRFLETGEYSPLGDSKVRHSKVRVLAATHQELADQSRFRKDLYHRLSRLDLHLPSLGERREDITYLSRFRIQTLNLQADSTWKSIDRGAEAVLEEMVFSGNVRELFNLIDHAWYEAIHQITEDHILQARGETNAEAPVKPIVPVLSTSGLEENSSLEVDFADAKIWNLDYTEPTSLKRLQERAACQMVRQTLDHFEGDVDQTADYLEVSRRSVYRYLERDRRIPMEDELS